MKKWTICLCGECFSCDLRRMGLPDDEEDPALAAERERLRAGGRVESKRYFALASRQSVRGRRAEERARLGVRKLNAEQLRAVDQRGRLRR